MHFGQLRMKGQGLFDMKKYGAKTFFAKKNEGARNFLMNKNEGPMIFWRYEKPPQPPHVPINFALSLSQFIQMSNLASVKYVPAQCDHMHVSHIQYPCERFIQTK